MPSVLRGCVMLERAVESYLKRRVKECGGDCEKHVSPGRNGVPDDIVSWPFGYKDWVECKRPKRHTLRKHQERDHMRRREMGHQVWLIICKDDVESYIVCCLARHARAVRRGWGVS